MERAVFIPEWSGATHGVRVSITVEKLKHGPRLPPGTQRLWARRFAGYGAGSGRGGAGSAARGGWARRGGKRQWRCGPASVRRVILGIFLCSLVVVVTDGVAGTAAQWSRDTTFLGSAMSTTVHCGLVCCVDGSEGRWKEVHGVWWGKAASAKPMGGKTI